MSYLRRQQNSLLVKAIHEKVNLAKEDKKVGAKEYNTLRESILKRRSLGYTIHRIKFYLRRRKCMYKTIEELNLDDDFLFAKVMSDKEICKQVIEKILGIKIKYIEMPTQQKVIDILLDSKAVRLDIYVNDENGTIYKNGFGYANKENGNKVEEDTVFEWGSRR